jgi:hypothetical protein
MSDGASLYLYCLGQELLLKGKAQSVILLVQTSLDNLLLILQTLCTFYNISYLNEEVKSSEPTIQLVFPALAQYFII